MAKVKHIAGTAGIYSFYCPGCGTYHTVFTKKEADYEHPIWSFNGDVDKPTFNPSVYVLKSHPEGAFRCHSFIRDGKIQYLPDCDHSLAGKTIEMMDV